MSRDKKILIICMLLTASGFLAFWQVNHHDFVSYDDTLYVTENSHIQSGLTPRESDGHLRRGTPQTGIP